MNQPQSQDIPLYNSRVIDTYVRLIRTKYPQVRLDELLSHAGMKQYEIADQGHWFSQRQIDLFYEKLVQLTGNESIAREAGRYVASPDAIGVLRLYVLSMIGPSHVFELLRQSSANLTKSAIYHSRKIASNKVEITVTPNPGITERYFQCQNRIGIFEAILCMFSYDLPVIEHEECMFRGATSCRYVITWKNSLSSRLKRATYILGVVLTSLCAVTLFTFPGQWINLVVESSFVLLLLSATYHFLGKKELEKNLDKVRESSNEVLEHVYTSYNNALMTNEFGQTLSKQTNVEDILSNAVKILEKRLDYDRAMLLLADPEKTKLIFHAGFGYTRDQLKLLNKTRFHLDRRESTGIFILSFREQKPFLINDLTEIENTLSLRSLALSKKLGSKSFICCPIVYEEESVGILAVDNPKSKRPLIQSDMSLLMGIAQIIGISIRNATLLENKERQFKSLLQVLAASIDARDSLTAGHSEKVTEYAVGICTELGLSDSFKEMIRVAALLHDYGKIGVPDAILKKEGKLTKEEYETVKTHAYKTTKLLEQINFEGILKQVPEIAGAHHEKIDGSGYPKGLTGKEIPFGAKIIAVADFFEAITAKRHYRDPLPIEVAFEMLQEESGKHFEKRIVQAFVDYYTKTYDCTTQERAY